MNTRFKEIVKLFQKLPGVGPRQAARFVIALMDKPESELQEFGRAVANLRKEISFCTAYPIKTIQAYLTTNQRCGYNIEENYFFLYFESKNTNLIIMHELFHFYTWHVFYRKLSEQGISKERYNDIKESLTVLLNIEFADLLDGAEDKGYPQHANLRNQIIDLRKPGKTLHEIVAILTV